MKNTDTKGGCRSCGAHLVEWDRIRAFDPDDIDHTFASLRLELIRHHYWHNEMPQKVVNYARRKGWSGLAAAVPARLQSAIGSPADDWDGRQTPVETSKGVTPINYAQHATATCCRKCLEVWYGITTDRPLEPAEIEYFSELALRYLRERLPGVEEQGVRVPAMRHS